MATEYIQVGLEESLKENAEKILGKLGLDIPSAFRLFLGKVVNEGVFPFETDQGEETGDNFSPAEIEEILRARAEASNMGAVSGPFRTPVEIIAYLDSLKV